MVVELSTLLTFGIGALALILLPGPNMLFIVSQSVTHGRRAGLVSALGVELGSMVHVTAAVLGLSAMLASSAMAIGVIKYAGAAYLVYLGLRTLRSQHGALAFDSAAPARRHSRLFVNGLIINLFNPKVALFFVAFLPQFVDPGRGSVALQLMVLGAVFCTVGCSCDVMYAVISGNGGDWLRGRGSFSRYQRYISAAVYFMLAVVAITAHVDRAPAAPR